MWTCHALSQGIPRPFTSRVVVADERVGTTAPPDPRVGALLWPDTVSNDLGWHVGTTALGAGVGWLATKSAAGATLGAAVGAGPVTAGIGWLITHTAKGALIGGAIGGGVTLLAILFGPRV